MARIWEPDIDVDQADAKALIERQFPGLSPVRLEPFGSGWDNVAFRVNDDFVFRFPRRRVAVRLLENEIRALGLILPHVPVRIPFPLFVGRDVHRASHPFAGYRLIEGTTACRSSLNNELRSRLATPLGQFLSALHSVPIVPQLAGDELNRSDIVRRRERVIENLRIAAPLVLSIDIAGLISEIERLAATELAKPDELRLVHGDLYARHIILNPDLGLAGIIDWGDVHMGDPALDLSIAFSFLPAGARDAFRRAYGTIEDATWDRARFRAIHYGALLTQYGTEIGDEAIRDAGIYALTASAD